MFHHQLVQINSEGRQMHSSKMICRCLRFQPLASQPMDVEQTHK